MLQDVNGPNGP